MLLGLLLALAGCVTGFHEKSEFRLATFNVRIWIDQPPNDLPSRIPRIAEVIVSNRFDVVGLEENCGHDKWLKPHLPGFASVSAGRDAKGEGEGMALLWLTNRFDLVSHDVIWLSETPHVKGSKSWNTACPRIALTGRFRDRANGRRFTYIVTHLDHVSSEARVRQMAMVMDLAKTAMKSGASVFVAGDMNDTERPKAVNAKEVAERAGPKGLMGDAIAYAKTVMADSLDVSKTPHTGPNETFTGYKRPYCRIDYIFVSPDIDVLTHATIDVKPNGQYASDHYPVAVDVRF